jgi:hypothetical protein
VTPPTLHPSSIRESFWQSINDSIVRKKCAETIAAFFQDSMQSVCGKSQAQEKQTKVRINTENEVLLEDLSQAVTE